MPHGLSLTKQNIWGTRQSVLAVRNVQGDLLPSDREDDRRVTCSGLVTTKKLRPRIRPLQLVRGPP